MAWSEQQIAHGKQELARRRGQTDGARFMNLVRVVCACVGCLLIAGLGVSMARHGADLLTRVSGACTACACVVGALLSLALTYVRYLDWHRMRRSS